MVRIEKERIDGKDRKGKDRKGTMLRWNYDRL
jgi:hypothetical protein